MNKNLGILCASQLQTYLVYLYRANNKVEVVDLRAGLSDKGKIMYDIAMQIRSDGGSYESTFLKALRAVHKIDHNESITLPSQYEIEKYEGMLFNPSNRPELIYSPTTSLTIQGNRRNIATSARREPKLLPIEAVAPFYLTLYLNKVLVEPEHGETISVRSSDSLKVDWRKGMKGTGKFKKEWAEIAINKFFSEKLSIANVAGLTKQNLYDSIKSMNDGSLGSRLVLEVLLEQIEAELATA